jgi:cytochrome oxidase Cu insertion factor (SCO1/SenC/PrrC family)
MQSFGCFCARVANEHGRYNHGAAAGGWFSQTARVTGSPEEMTSEYKVVYTKCQPPEGGPYLIDHTGFTYIVDAAGKYRGFFPPGTSEDRMREIIAKILAAP